MASGIAFARVITGFAFTCASTPAGVVYCWGRNADGQVGDGTTIQRRLPTLVVGNRKFEQMHTSNATTCGKTYADLAYCWGANGYGQIGDGTTDDRLRPIAVVGPP
jgi:alpha-tubulin suppressor-like RCC1 family protein